MNRSRTYCFSTLLVVLSCTAVYLLAYWSSIGSYTKSEWWVRDVYQYKEYLADSVDAPRIIIAAGSNALFGINSRVIEEDTGFPVVNLAVHGGLDIDFLYYKLEKHVRRGDIVVMPIEFGIYARHLNNEWFINNMISWGYQDYLRRLSLGEWIEFVFYTPKTRVLSGVLSRLGQLIGLIPPTPRALTRDEVIAIRENRHTSPVTVDWLGQGYRNLNSHGDIHVKKGPDAPLIRQYRRGIPYINFNLTDHFFEVFSRIRLLVESRHAKLLLTWPVTIKNNRFDLSLPEFKQRALSFKKRLSKRSVEISCNPALFSMDVRFFYNSVNHPNADGAWIRSKTLAGCINEWLDDENLSDPGFAESIEMVRALEARF